MRFDEILHGTEAEGKEKHVPIIEFGKGRAEGGTDTVRVTVGKETPHPNTVEHHIAWVEVFGVRKGGQVVDLGRSTFGPTYARPDVQLQVPGDQFTAFCALAYCNIHGVWQNCLEV